MQVNDFKPDSYLSSAFLNDLSLKSISFTLDLSLSLWFTLNLNLGLNLFMKSIS